MIYNYPYHINYFNRYNYNKNNINNNIDKKINHQVSNNTTDDSIITILGIKLSFDDLLILEILYLLYKENVKDISLYIILILLLLS